MPGATRSRREGDAGRQQRVRATTYSGSSIGRSAVQRVASPRSAPITSAQRARARRRRGRRSTGPGPAAASSMRNRQATTTSVTTCAARTRATRRQSPGRQHRADRRGDHARDEQDQPGGRPARALGGCGHLGDGPRVQVTRANGAVGPGPRRRSRGSLYAGCPCGRHPSSVPVPPRRLGRAVARGATAPCAGRAPARRVRRRGASMLRPREAPPWVRAYTRTVTHAPAPGSPSVATTPAAMDDPRWQPGMPAPRPPGTSGSRHAADGASRRGPCRRRDRRGFPRDWFVYLSVVAFVCGAVAITALEFGAGAGQPARHALRRRRQPAARDRAR